MKFVNPSVLFALGLIAIPIFIHLFNLRKYKIVYFSNVRFLKELKEETQKQSRLKHLLILLARIFTIVFLVLAFAQPYIPNKSEALVTEKDFISVFVDNSFSMEAVGTNGTLLQSAKEKAKEIINTHRNADVFQILDNNFLAVNQRNLNKDELKDIINKIDFSYNRRTLSQIIERQKTLANNSNFKQKFLYIISDFQKNIVDIQNIKPDSTVKIFLIPLKSNETNNLYIDSCWFESPIKRIGQNVVLKARIVNISDKPYEKIPARLYINKQQRTLTSFDVNPKSETTIELPYKINELGIQHAYIEIVDYPVTYDDKFYFSYTVQKNVSILCISNKDENIYINALFKKDSAFVLENVNARTLDYSGFSNYNFIILNEFDEITSGLGNELSKFVKNGGSLLILPGRNIDFESYNNFFPLLTKVSINKADTQTVKINKINFTHPLFNDVFDKLPENINLPDVKRHYVLNGATHTNSENLLTLQNGNPFLSVYYVGKGSLYLMASPLNKEFSNFAIHSIFVPTLYNMALNSVANSRLYYILGADNSFDIINANTDLEAVFKIKSTTNEFEFIPQYSNSFSYLTFHINDQIKDAGNYLLNYKENSISGIAFNYDRKESDLKYYSETELEEIIKDKKLENINIINTQKENVSNAISKINQGVLFWKFCIILALIFLAFEALLLRLWK